MTRMTAGEAMRLTASRITKNNRKKPRINWKKEVERQKTELCKNLICSLESEIRSVPKAWHRGYYSAITRIELMLEKLQ